MQGIESFIDALSLYITNNILFIVFLIAAIYILKKSSQKQQKYLIAVAVTAIVFIFNGITFAVVKRLGEDTTYYRFFWICPVVLASAYLMIELFFEKAVTKIQKFALLVIFGVMLFVNYGQSFHGWTTFPSNIYQIEDDIVQLGDMIDEHTGGERTILLVNDYIASHIREYNANIIINPDGKYYLDEIINGDNINYSARDAMMFVDSNMAEYIAIEKEKIGTNRLFYSIGCEKIGETDNFNVYHYDYELSEAEWELFITERDKNSLYINSEYINVPGLKGQKDYLYMTDLWVNTSEEERKTIIELANRLQVEAVIINSTPDNADVKPEDLERELAGLKVPYIYNNHGIQLIEEEEFLVTCITMQEVANRQEEELKNIMSMEKPMILVTDRKFHADDTDGVSAMVQAEDSPVVEVVTLTGGMYKEMLNDNIMQYGSMDVGADEVLSLVTLLRVKGLEAE